MNQKKETEIITLVGSTTTESNNKESLASELRKTDIPNTELLDNLGLYLTRQELSRINFMQKLYEKIIPVHGVVMEFGSPLGSKYGTILSASWHSRTF